MKLKKKRKGIALISVLLILTAMMVMTMGFASYTMQDYFVSKTFQQSNTCFYLASAGLDYFYYLLKHNMLVYPYYTASSDAYDANLFDGTSTTYGVGQISNVYNSSSKEFLVINRLAVPSDTSMFTAMDTSNACGTFKIKVTEAQDPNASDTERRVLFVTSTGYIKKVPSTVWSNSPSTWDTTATTFQVLGQRTIIARVPYYKTALNFDDTNGNSTADEQFRPDRLRTLMIDGWFERFR